jgi:hypothetical protein
MTMPPALAVEPGAGDGRETLGSAICRLGFWSNARFGTESEQARKGATVNIV